MQRFVHTLKRSLGCALFCSAVLLANSQLTAQSGLRESLERLDTDRDGEIDPDEITPRARPYLERIAKARRMSLDRPNDIAKWQEAARIYYAFQNGVAGNEIEPEDDSTVLPFGPGRDEPMIPEFGLAEVRYQYTRADVQEAERTMWRNDRNRDGFIDRDEARRGEWTHRNPFEMDLDDDGRLSRMELTQRYARRRMLSGASGELIRKAVRTGTGVRPSEPERSERRDDYQWWRRGGSGYRLTATVLDRFDSNRNGRLEQQEAVRLGIPPGRIDVDQDGQLSRDELHEFLVNLQEEAGDLVEGLPGWFYELDANRDRQVAMSEFATEWTEEKLTEFEQLDANGDGLLTTLEVLQSRAMVGGSYVNDEALVLPPRKTVISEIQVDEDYLIGDLNVQVSITHTHTSYLDAYLTGPDGQRVELFSDVGREGDHFERTIFDDQAGEPITKARPPFEGRYLPGAAIKKQPSLSYFNGKSIKGVWQLVIRSSRSDRFGMLHSWGLIVKPDDEIVDRMIFETAEGASEADENAEPSGNSAAAELIKRIDKNGDGVLTIDEYEEKDRQRFASTDSNGDGRVDASEVAAAIARFKGGD
jgi:subtilisin-like proprotein convertase family protein